MTAERLWVTAAVVRKGQRVLLARRLPEGPRGGLWEFPGGKVEAGESPEEALRRELAEELGVGVEVGRLFLEVDHDYPDRAIRLSAYECVLASGEPQPLECAEVRWVESADLTGYPLTQADVPLRERLLSEGT